MSLRIEETEANKKYIGGVASCEGDPCSFPGALREGSAADAERSLQVLEHGGQIAGRAEEHEERVEYYAIGPGSAQGESW